MKPVVKRLGRVDYQPTFQAMLDFTASRTAETPDEIWIVEHPPVYTLGQAGKPEHILKDVGIPIVKIDRGGQVTYHGPGQVVIYLLLDLARLKTKVRELVTAIEQAVIDLLAGHGVTEIGLGIPAEPLCRTPGRRARRLCRRRKNRRPRFAHSQRLQLPRCLTQCRYGSFPLCGDQSLRLCWPESRADQRFQYSAHRA